MNALNITPVEAFIINMLFLYIGVVAGVLLIKGVFKVVHNNRFSDDRKLDIPCLIGVIFCVLISILIVVEVYKLMFP